MKPFGYYTAGIRVCLIKAADVFEFYVLWVSRFWANYEASYYRSKEESHGER